MQALRKKHLKSRIVRGHGLTTVYTAFSELIGSVHSYMRVGQREIATSRAPDQVLFISLLILIGLASVSLGSIEPWGPESSKAQSSYSEHFQLSLRSVDIGVCLLS